MLLGTLLLSLLAGALSAAGAPNIVVMLADDLGYGDVRAYNPNSNIPTPNLDRIAMEGIRFTDAHTPDGVCSPTRYGLLTGRYAWRTSLQRGVLKDSLKPLIESERLTLGGMLRQLDYETRMVGNRHLGRRW